MESEQGHSITCFFAPILGGEFSVAERVLQHVLISLEPLTLPFNERLRLQIVRYLYRIHEEWPILRPLLTLVGRLILRRPPIARQIYAITHADKESGYNLGHTREGAEGLWNLIHELPPDVWRPGAIPLVVAGSGLRFREMYGLLCLAIPGFDRIPVVFTPSCGGAVSRTRAGDIAIIGPEREIPAQNYLGIWRNGGLWEWLSDLPERTILCTGRGLIQSAYEGQSASSPKTSRRVFSISPLRKKIEESPSENYQRATASYAAGLERIDPTCLKPEVVGRNIWHLLSGIGAKFDGSDLADVTATSCGSAPIPPPERGMKVMFGEQDGGGRVLDAYYYCEGSPDYTRVSFID